MCSCASPLAQQTWRSSNAAAFRVKQIIIANCYIIITPYNAIITYCYIIITSVITYFYFILTLLLHHYYLLLRSNRSIIAYYCIVNTLLLRIITSVITSFPIIT